MKEKYNLSLLLIYPLIFDKDSSSADFADSARNYLIDGYINDINKPWLDNNFMLRVSVEDSPQFKISHFVENENYKTRFTYLMGKEWFDVYVFDIPDRILSDYELIKENRFNEVNVMSKIRILNFWRDREESEQIVRLFNNQLNDFDINEEYVPEKKHISSDGLV